MHRPAQQQRRSVDKAAAIEPFGMFHPNSRRIPRAKSYVVTARRSFSSKKTAASELESHRGLRSLQVRQLFPSHGLIEAPQTSQRCIFMLLSVDVAAEATTVRDHLVQSRGRPIVGRTSTHVGGERHRRAPETEIVAAKIRQTDADR